MNKPKLLGIVAFSGLAVIISCDNGTGGTAGGLDANDCPVGTFRPLGLTDCVFPAVDVNGQPIGVSDNRCASGQPAVPPQCVSESGGRSYLSSSTTCVTGYRFLPGACNRNDGTAGFGTAGFATGFGTGSAGSFGGAGAAGSFEQGFGGDNGAAAGMTGTAGTSTGAAAESGTGAAGSSFPGSGGTSATAGMSGQSSSSDASSDAF